MKNKKILASVLSFMLIFGGFFVLPADAQTKPKTKKKKVVVKPTPADKKIMPNGSFPNVEDPSMISVSPSDGVTMLVSNQTVKNSVSKPFVFVARDAKTYDGLRNKVSGLPTTDAIDFKKYFVVAAFLGVKRTGGYGIKINKIGDAVQINAVEPPKDAMVTMALTNPFAAAKIEIINDETAPVRIADDWMKDSTNYEITTSNFVTSGGFVANEHEIELEGTINLSQMDNFVTAQLLISRSGSESNRRIKELATGFVEPDGTITFFFVPTGNLLDSPSSPLKASGKLTKDSLVLNFESLPWTVSDGFEGKGRIEAKRR